MEFESSCDMEFADEVTLLSEILETTNSSLGIQNCEEHTF